MMRRISLAFALASGLAAPAAQADPTIGFGLSIAFGGGATDVGLGVRIFSDDEEESAVGSIGVDYMFQSGGLRPTVGVAYLDRDIYLGLDLGYNFTTGAIDYGVSAGGVDTSSDDSDDEPAGETGGGEGGEGGGGEGEGLEIVGGEGEGEFPVDVADVD